MRGCTGWSVSFVGTSRWGLNWKRGRVGDMSQDVVTYNFSADADEGTTNVYILDVIGGHCGSNPQAACGAPLGRIALRC